MFGIQGRRVTIGTTDNWLNVSGEFPLENRGGMMRIKTVKRDLF
jgi:hypothetical protein